VQLLGLPQSYTLALGDLPRLLVRILMDTRAARNIVIAVLAIAICALSVSNVILRRRLGAALRSAASHQPPFNVGEVLPRFGVRDRNNVLMQVGGPDGHERVVVFFLPGCNPCEEVLDEVAAKPNPNTLLVSVLSQQLSTAEVSKLASALPVYAIDDFVHSPVRSRVRSVPQILRVDSRGVVTAVCAAYEPCLPK
jgi:hypothetical protein